MRRRRRKGWRRFKGRKRRREKRSRTSMQGRRKRSKEEKMFLSLIPENDFLSKLVASPFINLPSRAVIGSRRTNRKQVQTI